MTSLPDGDHTPISISERPRSSPRAIISGAAALVAVLLLALLANVIFANHPRGHITPAAAATATPPATPFPTAKPGTQHTQDTLLGISMTSPTDGWAVGHHDVITTIQEPNETGVSSALLYHFSNGIWQPVDSGLPSSTLGGQSLDAISMIDAHDGWAVGTEAVGAAANTMLILHYTGAGWNVYPISQHGELVDVQMISANEGWAISGGTPTAQPVILHYLNGTWSVQYTLPSLSGNASEMFNKLSMVNANDGWVVGTSYTYDANGGTTTGVFLHYQHGTWRLQQSLPGISPTTISMVSGTNGWAAALALVGNTSAVYHYQSGVWREVPDALAPAEKGLHSSINATTLHMNSAGDGWLGEAVNDPNHQDMYLYHFDGTTWHLVTVPVANSAGNGISDITFLPNGEGWLAGLTFIPQSATVLAKTLHALILHFVNGSWNVQLR